MRVLISVVIDIFQFLSPLVPPIKSAGFSFIFNMSLCDRLRVLYKTFNIYHIGHVRGRCLNEGALFEKVNHVIVWLVSETYACDVVWGQILPKSITGI